MFDRHAKSPNTPSPPQLFTLEEIKTDATNWSTSTLGLETELALHNEALRSDGEIPLSSFKSYPPTPTPPPPATRPDSKSRPRAYRRNSPVLTITDHDIAAGTTPSTGECQREQSSRAAKKSKRRKRKLDRDTDDEKISTIQAWSQVDPLYGMYQQERMARDRRRDADRESKSRFADIRAFDFMSYGGSIVI